MSLLSIQYVGEVGSSEQNGVPPRTDVLCSTYHDAQGTNHDTVWFINTWTKHLYYPLKIFRKNKLIILY